MSDYVNKAQKGNVEYDIHDARIADASVLVTTSDLATVATTGDYDDLLNIPDAVVANPGGSGPELTTISIGGDVYEVSAGGASITYATNNDIDNMFRYAVTKNLTSCTLSNDATYVEDGNGYSAQVIPTSYEYEFRSLTVTMGGVDMSQFVMWDTVNIPAVTGDIVVTAVCEIPVVYKYVKYDADAHVHL